MRALCTSLFLAGTLSMLGACGADPPPAPVAPPPPVAAAPPAPRCAAGVSHAPDDARAKMGTLGDDVRRCFLVGRPGEDGDKIVVEVAIAEDGGVRSAKVIDAPAGKAGASSCAEQALKRATFASFCGDEVAVRWTYAMQSR